MRRKLFLIVIGALLLAACNGPAAPTPVAQNNLPVGDATETPPAVLATTGPREYATDGPVLSMPGTIIPPATEDPDAGKIFDTITFGRMGGIGGKPLDIILMSNGNLTRDGASSTISTDQVKLIDDMLDKMGFFGMSGIFQAAGTSADAYTYTITVDRDGSSASVTAKDGYIPPQLAELIQTLQQLGESQ